MLGTRQQSAQIRTEIMGENRIKKDLVWLRARETTEGEVKK